MSSSELQQGISQNKNLESTDQCLLLFGNGDGGGGPTSLMLEKLRRLNSASVKSPEVPKTKISKVERFFEHLKEKTQGGKTLSNWKGELYFELHRGIFTSQAQIKNGNQTIEKLLRDLEYFGTLASLTCDTYAYPKSQLDEIWQDVLLNQFHDVLPGTSIKMVNDDAKEIYERRIAQTHILLDQALDVLLPQGDGEVTILDGTRLNRSGVVELPPGLKEDKITTQPGLDDKVLAYYTSSSGIGTLSNPPDSATPSAKHENSTYTLSNDMIRLTISHGRITSLYDLMSERELIVSGIGTSTAGLMLYEDYPLSYDAWEAEVYHLKMGREVMFDRVEIVANGPLRSTIRTESVFGESKVVLYISVDTTAQGDIPSIRVDARVDWHETHKFLKFALPLDIHSSTATYGTQFGLIERPTHRNTQIDQAKFEVPAHTFADVSEAGYGLSVVSDDKYGYIVEGNTMRISLLRSATAPDPTQDRGHHKFTFHVLPHRERLIESGVYEKALGLINPLRVRRIDQETKPTLPITFTLHPYHASSDGVVLETIKRGEDDSANSDSSVIKHKTIILRLYESLGGRSKTTLKITGLSKPSSLKWLNILEEAEMFEDQPVKWRMTDGVVEIDMDFRCFEIKTLGILLE
uniref:alpha-mannosidase n=1 Tax=Kwoniella bestiolae CBS 10118 TaxID=1296100 RepID=A0A1B9FZA2_9TREE|nr:hypothetical protein I302_05547 [Kwoniella bestiolae CBS 10118]OCF24090.1 hypothetical protein I302_05547 [Kwoniella bestiolae CBS 10118]